MTSYRSRLSHKAQYVKISFGHSFREIRIS
jgi:hypothetical protein